MRQRRTRQEWQALLDEQPRSGLSIQRFCQSEGITPSSFYSWRTKLRRGESSAADPLGAVESMADSPWIALTPPAAFGELSAPAELTEARAAKPDETTVWDVELSLPRGIVLRMRAG